MSWEELSQGAGSAFPPIDGVPIKLSDKYKPLKKVTLPLNFQQRDISSILNLQYDFTLETDVIEWTEAQKESQLMEEQAHFDNIATNIEQLGKDNDSMDIDIEGADFAPEGSHTIMPEPDDDDQNHVSDQQIRSTENVAPLVAQVPSVDVPLNIWNNILQPVQIQPNKQTNQPKPAERSTSFNLADFERVQDPFDSVELKTLNDFEELGKVLQNTQVTSAVSQSGIQPGVVKDTFMPNGGAMDLNRPVIQGSATSGPPIQQYSEQRAQAVASLNRPSNSINQTIRTQPTATLNQGTVSFNKNSDAVTFPTVPSNVKIPRSINQQTAVSVPSSSAANNSASNPFTRGQVLPPIGSSFSDQDEFGLPRIPHCTLASIGATDAQNRYSSSLYSNSCNTNNSASTHNGTPVQSSAATGTVQNSFVNSHDAIAANGPYNPWQLPPYTPRRASQPVPVPTPQSNHVSNQGRLTAAKSIESLHKDLNANRDDVQNMTRLQKCKSNPDLTEIGGLRKPMGKSQTKRPYPVSKTPPPYPVSTKVPDESSSPPPPYTLGSSPPPYRHSPSPLTEPPQSHNGYGASPTPSAITSLPNPYPRLSSEHKLLVDNISAMGFPHTRVARAVEKYKEDDKMVVDYLCSVNRLIEKGNHGDKAEDALNLYDNNEEKASEYLEVMGQLAELGFAEDKIKEALVLTDNNRENALDHLI
ncbi:unnamed protein product [Owenia fusiformis]|uniref:Uncharacterized protein n=1 Tax=Owenia fusiformis TaxID=6347 RepID=A0A8J1TY49_OWEFU|nr:unnamed protein product [Owenia fusiformis]